MMLNIILLFLLLVAVTTLFVVLSEFVAFLRTRVPFVPTSRADIEFIVKKLGIAKTDVFYDLGSGNGKVVFLVNQLTGAKCVGFELGWWTILFAQIKRKALSVKQKVHPLKFAEGKTTLQIYDRIKFKHQNFFQANWSEANYIYTYLYPPLMRRVEEKFLADCKPGSIAIVRDFPFPNMPYLEKYYLPKEHEIYVYKKM